ncbi:MAG: hypothetical protein J6P53_07165 [Mailhella sp.]|nr:hypothetical protein [Mailhella sp.]
MDQATFFWGLPSFIALILAIAALFTTRAYPAREERKSKGAGFLFWMIVSWALAGICNMLQQWTEGRGFSWQVLLFTLFFSASAVIMYVKANKPAA